MFVEVYLHSSKETMWDKGEQIGLTGEALMNFRYACTEVKIGLDVDEEGNAKIISVDDRLVS